MSGEYVLKSAPVAMSSISVACCFAAWISFFVAGSLNPIVTLAAGLALGSSSPLLAKLIGKAQNKCLYVGFSLNTLSTVLLIGVLLSGVPVQD